jgi:hypothetical protein
MPFDYGLRLDNRQRIANARAKPVEANKNQAVNGTEGLFLRSGSPQNVYLLPQRQNFRLERCPRPKQICDHPNNEPDKISHPTRASPDSRSTASQIEFATGTRISDEQLSEIAVLQADMVEHYRARDLLSYYRCNRLIHEAIVRAADNAVLAGFYESIAARIRRARFITPMSPEHWALAIQEHEGILNALQRRDASGLAHILRTHLRRKREEVVQAGFAEQQ